MSPKYFFLILASSLACATESFENVPAGAVSFSSIEYGTLNAAPGHAEILQSAARTGKKTLRILGGKDRAMTLTFNQPLSDSAMLSCWLERWTANGPFNLRLIAFTESGSKVILDNQPADVKGYLRQATAILPAGTKAIQFICTSDDKGGVLIDDMELYIGPMKLSKVEFVNPGAQPMLKRAPINPVFSYKISTTGASQSLALDSLKIKIHPADAVSEVTIRSGKSDRSVDGTIGMKFRNGKVYGKAKPAADGTVTIPCSAPLTSGETEIWVDATPSGTTRVGDSVTFESATLTIGGQEYTQTGMNIKQNVGYLLAVPDATVVNPKQNGEERSCITYRIPGLIRTSNGTLLACFDARYENHLDLSADIDVAVVRSEDGGYTWSEPSVAMDAGPGKGNGCGDPCILQDKKTGRIWLQSLATHFDRNPCILRSRSGYDPADTGQWEMVYSDDDGRTWSKHVNVTRQIKEEQWTTILAGPGCGICTSKGVLVFPAQIWDLRANPISMSTICYSTDNGKTWHYGKGVPHRTSECQVVELQDGALMLTCRNETFQGKRVVYVTRDLGKTWQPHETNTNTLNDPACQASLVVINSQKYGRVMLYSHPNSNPKLRNHMTIRASLDDGKTWNEGVVYDVRECWGYSCIAQIDDENVGVIYEPAHVSETNDYHGMGFLRIPLSEILNTAPLKK